MKRININPRLAEFSLPFILLVSDYHDFLLIIEMFGDLDIVSFFEELDEEDLDKPKFKNIPRIGEGDYYGLFY